MAALSRGEWPTSIDASVKPIDRIDHLVSSKSTSKRLQQVVSSLEAEYAVLSEASAKSAELQATLRNSQPLLWLDNALVLQRDKAPAVQKLTQRRHAIAERSDATDEDATWDEVFVESDRRRRHRVQWEIAKRIARVEREITRQPTAQRSWHVREKKRLQEEEKRRQEEIIEQEKQRRQHERDERQRMEKLKKEAQRREAKRTAFTPPKMETTVKLKPPTRVDKDLDFDWSTRPEKVGPARATGQAVRIGTEEKEDEADKENARPLLTVEIESSPVLSKSNVTEEADASDKRLLAIVRESLEETILPITPPPPTAPVTVTDREGDGALGDPAGHTSKARANTRPYPTSSLCRQVLSEYRTMPTTVSFGAPVLEGTRLNNDVVRRLFNDVDGDRDGHLNRLEMSLALHRLQIAMPAPRIVAFFKRIHAQQNASQDSQPLRGGKRRRDRVRSHEPLKELINYKQFVAFVTTAMEQQQQRRMAKRHQPPPSHIDGFTATQRLSIPPLQVPSRLEDAAPSLTPSRNIASPLRIQPSLSLPREHAEDKPRRIVEQHNEEDDGDDVADRVLRQLPDYLMVRALAAADAPPADVQQFVRRSLEKLGQGTVEDAIVQDVTRDLVQKYVEKVLSTRQKDGVIEDDEIHDVSGIRRAAAYFDSLGDSEGTPLECGDDEETKDWWKVLTEEQVAVLVQEIWTQRLHARSPTIVSTAETKKDVASVQQPSSPQLEAAVVCDPDSVLLIEAGSLPEVTDHVRRVAEKSIQTGSIELTSSALASPPPPPPPPAILTEEIASFQGQLEESIATPSMRTALALAVLAGTRADLQSERHTETSGSRTKQVLAKLRRQRRRRQAMAPVSNSMESVVDSIDSASIDAPLPAARVPTTSEYSAHRVQPFDHEDNQAVSELQVSDTVEPTASVIDPAPSPLPTREIHLHSATEMPPRNHSIRSSHASSSDIFSSYNSSLSSTSPQLFREHSVNGVWRYAAERRRQRLGRRQRPTHRVARASVDAEDEADLSEGEIVQGPQEDNLSDGEVFGGTRRMVVRAKNARSADVSRSVDNEPIDSEGGHSNGDSLESGEMLPPMTAIHRTYQQKLIRLSVSSLESGEAEDGVANA